jgi:hypothetical protein
LYTHRPNLLLGFHGCEKDVQEKLLIDNNYFKRSTESFDWLGHGMYFWENDPERALSWASEKKKAGNLEHPASIGAVIDLGYCLDLMDSKSISTLKNYHTILVNNFQKAGLEIPQNKNHPKETGNDKTLRYLDCAVIELMHSELAKAKKQPFDSVRAVFIEGDPIYSDAGFSEKTHIQICIRNPNCIKGFFLPRKKVSTYSLV